MTCWSRSLAKLLSVNNIESWHNITSAKREAIINVFFLLFLEFCTSDIRRFRKANIVICDDMYSCNTYHVSIGSNGFWILRVTIYSRIHKSYAPPPLLLSPSSSCRADSLFLYLRPGKLRWWWVFTHPLNYTLSAQLKNPGGPPSADLQNLRSSKKPSNRIERKIRFLLSLPRFQLFMLSHTYRNFCSFLSDHYTLCLKIIQKGLFFADFSWFLNVLLYRQINVKQHLFLVSNEHILKQSCKKEFYCLCTNITFMFSIYRKCL